MRRFITGALAAAFVGAGIVFIAVAARDYRSSSRPASVEPGFIASADDLDVEPTATTAAGQAPAATPTAESNVGISRLLIPRIGVNAPTVLLGVDADGVMQSPKRPMDVGWYTFSAKPGQKGNIVVTGHVDYVNFGAAVFWRLRELRGGDDVQIELEDGRVLAYRVMSSTTYDADTAPVAEIVGPTPTEVLTLITCTGQFDTYAREYNKRLVVRAERVY